MRRTEYPHIVVDEHDTPLIEGTRLKIPWLAAEHAAGVTVNDLVRDYPPLTVAQVYSGLAYYYDHQDEIARYLAERDRMIDQMEAEAREANAAFYARARAVKRARKQARE